MRGQTFLFVLLLLCTPLHSWATTYYVTPSGGQGGCSTNTNSPQNGLNNGIACLSGGDTVVAKSGTYAEGNIGDNIPNGSSGAHTIVKSEVLHGAIVRPTGFGQVAGYFHGNKHFITLDGFVFDGTNAGVAGGELDVHAQAGLSDLLFQNIEIRQVAGDTTGNNQIGYITTAAIGAAYVTTNVVFRNMYVHDIGYNQPIGSSCNECYGYGIYLSGNGYTLENSTFLNIAGYGVHGYSSGVPATSNDIVRNNRFENIGTAGILLCQHDNQIYNNLIIRAGLRTGGGIEIAGSCSGQPSYNNIVDNNTIVSGNGQCIDLGYTSNSAAQNNICWQNGTNSIAYNPSNGNTVNGSNLLGTDPQFVNAGGGDYHLQSGSPAATGGLNLSNLYTTDLAGTTRPGSGTWTRGAYTIGGSFGPVTNLFVSVQPAGGLSDTSLATWTVQARDSSNNVVTNYTGTVSIAIGTNPGNAVPSGVLSKTFTAGVVSWDGLSLNKIGAGYTYVVTSSTFSTTTAPFTITGIAPNAPTNVRATPIP